MTDSENAQRIQRMTIRTDWICSYVQ